MKIFALLMSVLLAGRAGAEISATAPTWVTCKNEVRLVSSAPESAQLVGKFHQEAYLIVRGIRVGGWDINELIRFWDIHLMQWGVRADPGTITTNADGSLQINIVATVSNRLATVSVLTTAPLAGGGNISTNLNLRIARSTNAVDGYLHADDFTRFDAASDAIPLISAQAQFKYTNTFGAWNVVATNLLPGGGSAGNILQWTNNGTNNIEIEYDVVQVDSTTNGPANLGFYDGFKLVSYPRGGAETVLHTYRVQGIGGDLAHDVTNMIPFHMTLAPTNAIKLTNDTGGRPATIDGFKWRTLP